MVKNQINNKTSITHASITFDIQSGFLNIYVCLFLFHVFIDTEIFA